MRYVIMGILLLGLISCVNGPVDVSDEDKKLHEMPEDITQTNEKLLEDKDVPINTDTVEYYKNIKGFYAEPVEEGSYPGVVMIHEWWGLNDHIKNMAKKLAAEGYKVLAVDLYQGQVASKAEDAMTYMKGVNQAEATENMKAATDYLQTKGATKLGSLGWCFGGAQSLQVSLAKPLDATVIYYGHLETDEAKLNSLKGPVLGIFASKDKSIPPADVHAFENALNNIGHENDITIYEGVDHAFANPSGARYSPEETKLAWAKTLKFLEEKLK